MIKFGLKPAMGRSLAQNNDPVAELNTIIDFAKAARDDGFDSIWVGQHYFGGERVRWEAVPLLARLIPELKDTTVGTCIFLLPLHHPVLVAEQIAVLDIISGGKFVFGAGLGYRPREFAGFAVPKRERATRFEEALTVIKILWGEKPAPFHGKHFHFDELRTPTKPLQKPGPPIWIAAHGDKAIRRAARLGDSLMLNPHAAFATLARQLDIYRDELRLQNKPFPDELAIRKDIYIAETRAQAWHEAEKEVPRLVQNLTAESQYAELPSDDPNNVEQDLKAYIRDRFIVGDPGDCIEQMAQHRSQLGVNHFIFRIACPAGDRQTMLSKIKLMGRDMIAQMPRP
jgi:alkanesulfonate monooxygenase SsuD/methylene tetrahydromethanopterin reductase-like flavin-dependent oxidoreductase (luciferase family)